MKKWTKEQLEAEGYKIWNAEIKNVSLSMEDHACLVSYLSLDGHGPCCCYGGYVLGKGYVGAKNFKGYASGIEAIMRIMDTVGCSKYEDMKEKADSAIESFVDEIQEVLNKYQRKFIF